MAHHLSESEVEHNLFNLDLALRMQGGPYLIKYYIKELKRLNKAITFLEKSCDDIEECKTLVRDSKNIILSHIEEVFASLDKGIEEFSIKVDIDLKCLRKYKSYHCDEGRVLLDKYRSKKSIGYLKNHIKALHIPVDEICNFITRSIKYDTLNSENQDTIQDFKIKLQSKDRYIQELA